jgi:hypothetical protein
MSRIITVKASELKEIIKSLVKEAKEESNKNKIMINENEKLYSLNDVREIMSEILKENDESVLNQKSVSGKVNIGKAKSNDSLLGAKKNIGNASKDAKFLKGNPSKRDVKINTKAENVADAPSSTAGGSGDKFSFAKSTSAKKNFKQALMKKTGNS